MTEACPACGQPLPRSGELRLGKALWRPDALFYGGVRIALTPQQHAIAGALIEARGATLTPADLKAAMQSAFATQRSLKVQLTHLRAALRPHDADWHIVNEHGRGYKWLEQ